MVEGWKTLATDITGWLREKIVSRFVEIIYDKGHGACERRLNKICYYEMKERRGKIARWKLLKISCVSEG